MKIASLILLLASFAGAQAKPKIIVDNGPPDAYLFSDAEHAQLRDLQYRGDQLEIFIQKLNLQIEQAKAQQKQFLDQMLQVAAEVASRRHISLDLYELDAVQMKFVRKKRPAK